MPVTQTFATSRNATWAPTLRYDYDGPPIPLAGVVMSMELRLYPGQPDDPLLRIASIPFSENLLSGAPGQADERRRLQLEPVFTTAQLATLPGLQAPEVGDPQIFVFDILIVYTLDNMTEVLASGQFIVTPGVTKA